MRQNADMGVRERIWEKIRELETNPTAVSEAAGLTNSALHKFLDGKTKSMRTENLEKIAKVLKTSISWLTGGTEPPPNAEVQQLFSSLTAEQRRLAMELMRQLANPAESEGTAEA